MNPYQNINKKNGLKDNEKSPFYGCYSLFFHQVYPFKEPNYGGALVKIKNEFINDAETIYEILNDISQNTNSSVGRLFHFHQQEENNSKNIFELNFFNNGDYFFEISQTSTNLWIGMENFYLILLDLSPLLEDFHFFVHSVREENSWLDEYINKNGQLSCNRCFYDISVHHGELMYYINKTNESPADKQFKLFTTWQLYNRLKFSIPKDNTDINNKTNIQFIHNCYNYHLLDKYFNTLSNIYQQYFLKKEYNVINNFKTWRLNNQV